MNYTLSALWVKDVLAIIYNEYLLKNVDNLKCSTIIKAMQFTLAVEHKIGKSGGTQWKVLGAKKNETK